MQEPFRRPVSLEEMQEPDEFTTTQERVDEDNPNPTASRNTPVSRPLPAVRGRRDVTAVPTTTLPTQQGGEQEEEEEVIYLTVPHPSEFSNARYIKTVGNILFVWLGVCIGNGGQSLTSIITVMVLLYQHPQNFLPGTWNPFASACVYFLVRLIIALIVGFFFQTVLALSMIHFLDDLSKILNLDQADKSAARVIIGFIVVIGLFTLGANFFSDATVIGYITTSSIMVILFTAILTVCSAGATTLGRLVRNYAKLKLEALYGREIAYYQHNQLALRTEVQTYLDQQKAFEDASGFRRMYMNLFM